jgi:hypothetical protein
MSHFKNSGRAGREKNAMLIIILSTFYSFIIIIVKKNLYLIYPNIQLTNILNF